MWSLFIEQWNGIALFLSSFWDTFETLSLFTDASGSIGYGGFFQTSWFHGTSLPHQQLGSPGMSILWQALFAIVGINKCCFLLLATCGGTSGHLGVSSSIVTIWAW